MKRLLVILPVVVLLWSAVCLASDCGLTEENRRDNKPGLAQLTIDANKGMPDAQVAFGFVYVCGQGVSQDYTQAALWFRKAADQGDSLGQFMLGSRYKNGQGVPQDYGQAVLWFRKAAEQGSGFGQYRLGEMYENGQGIPQNYVEAYKWYNLAAQNTANDHIQGLLDLAIKGRDRAGEKMKEARIQARQSQKPNMKACITSRRMGAKELPR